MSRIYRGLVLSIILLITIIFGSWSLSESPGTWGDEGMLIELAVNLVRHGAMETQLAPGVYISGALMTTGFPVIYPVAASFKLFGISLLHARYVMVVYMLLAVTAIFLFVKRISGTPGAALAALLVATYPSFYGDGKNVLGEVPGLFFLISFLFCIHQVEKSDHRRRLFALLAGLAMGLCLVTKPIFLVLLPATIGGAILLRKLPKDFLKILPVFALGLIIPIIFWLKTQFLPGDSVHDILSFYANPYRIDDIPSTILQNLKRFFTEVSPIYMLIFFGLWSTSFLSRLWRNLRAMPNADILYAEAIAYSFTGLVLIAYLRTPGWYRFFFPAQIVAFIYAPNSLHWCYERAREFLARHFLHLTLPSAAKHIPAVTIIALIVMQAYQTAFHSWIATTYSATMTSQLTEYLPTLGSTKTFFTAPELIVFLPNNRYSQFIDINGFQFGRAQLEDLKNGGPDILISTGQEWDTTGHTQYPLYQEINRIGRYVFAERKK